MNYKKLLNENPFKEEKELKVKLGGKSDMYGACSIENFSGIASNLSLTHEDAQGFLYYPTSFNAANFWKKDGDVKVWLYEEAFDNWKDLYGMDAVRVFYHSGHGGMSNNGIFYAPMGGYWDNRARVYSDKMIIGNEHLRYLFWSTCLSLRIKDGHSPIRTWGGKNKKGLRMVFGYETVSYDNKNYGRYFWEEWKKGKTFRDSFLNASRRISVDQIPVVCAFGENASDARNRLLNERYFNNSPVNNHCCSWSWIEAKKRMSAPAKANMLQSNNNDVLLLSSKVADDDFLSAVARKVGITQRTSNTINFDEFGNRQIGTKKIKVNLSNRGELSMVLANANHRNTSLISESKATKIAKDFISDLGIDKGIKLVQDTTLNSYVAGGNVKTEEMYDKHIVETTIQFRQIHDNMASVNSGSGIVSVTIDNDGKITSMSSSVKKIEGVRKQANIVEFAKARKVDYKPESREEMFENKINQIIGNAMPKDGRMLSANANREAVKPSVKIIDEKTGYDFSSNYAKPVHQRDVEIQFGEFAKRYKLRIDI